MEKRDAGTKKKSNAESDAQMNHCSKKKGGMGE